MGRNTRLGVFVVSIIALVVLAGAVAAITFSHREGRGSASESASKATEAGADAEVDGERGGEAADNAGRAAAGTTSLSRIHHRAPAAGWAGENINGAGNTWEPAIAADPAAPYVYTMYNDFSGTKSCQTCPTPFMVVRASSNGGSTFGPEVRICACPHIGFQYDPVIAVASTGTVYAAWLNNYTIAFSKSTDHGVTWSAPIKVSGKVSSDKPWMGISKNGTDVYIDFAKGTGGDLYETHSHNGGTSFSAAQMIGTVPGVHYFYPNGLAVLPSGTAVLSASQYPNSNSQTSTSPISISTFRTTNGGTSWTRVNVDSVFAGPVFKTASTTTLSADATGNLVVEYGGATTAGANDGIWTQRSTDGGVTWTGKTLITPATGGGDASFPAIAGGAAGNFRLTYMDNRGGAWNVWYRASTDGGVTWSADLRISDATSGAPYKSAAGFTDVYGDYDMIAITNLGKSVAVSGQSSSFDNGPGNIWFNRQT